MMMMMMNLQLVRSSVVDEFCCAVSQQIILRSPTSLPIPPVKFVAVFMLCFIAIYFDFDNLKISLILLL